MKVGIDLSIPGLWQSVSSPPVVVPNPPAMSPGAWSLVDTMQGGELALTIITVAETATGAQYAIGAGAWVSIPAAAGTTNLDVGTDGTYTVSLRWVQTISAVDYFGTADDKTATATTATVATWSAQTVHFGAAA